MASRETRVSKMQNGCCFINDVIDFWKMTKRVIRVKKAWKQMQIVSLKLRFREIHGFSKLVE